MLACFVFYLTINIDTFHYHLESNTLFFFYSYPRAFFSLLLERKEGVGGAGERAIHVRVRSIRSPFTGTWPGIEPATLWSMGWHWPAETPGQGFLSFLECVFQWLVKWIRCCRGLNIRGQSLWQSDCPLCKCLSFWMSLCLSDCPPCL